MVPTRVFARTKYIIVKHYTRRRARPSDPAAVHRLVCTRAHTARSGSAGRVQRIAIVQKTRLSRRVVQVSRLRSAENQYVTNGDVWAKTTVLYETSDLLFLFFRIRTDFANIFIRFNVIIIKT